MRRIAFMVIVAAASGLAGASASGQSAPPPDRPLIFTVTPKGLNRISFAAGERFVVLGRGFPGKAQAVVTFEQNTETELGTFTTLENGNLRADVRVPSEASEGPATIRAASGDATASAVLDVSRGGSASDAAGLVDDESADGERPAERSDASADDSAGRGGLTGGVEESESLTALWPWAVALAIVIGAVVFSVWRRRRASGEAVRQRGTKRPDGTPEAQREPEAQPDPEPAPATPAEGSSGTVRQLRDDISAWTRKQ